MLFNERTFGTGPPCAQFASAGCQLAWQMFTSKATITAQFFVLILADNVSNALEGDASSLERVRLPCSRRQPQMVDNNYI